MEIKKEMINIYLAVKIYNSFYYLIYLLSLFLLLLLAHVYEKIKDKSLIHDSFLCKVYNDGKPFPSKRLGALFGPVNEYDFYAYNKTFHAEFPIECRPKDHQDWKTC
jgi:hypothetical protein